MNRLVQGLIAVCCLLTLNHVSGVACPKTPGLRVSSDIQTQCYDKIDESVDECLVLVKNLRNLDNPTAQERFDLADALLLVSLQESDGELQDSMDKQALSELRRLHEEFPDDVEVMSHLSVLGDDKDFLNFKRRIAELAPDCTGNTFWLVEELGRLTGHGWNRADQDSDLVRELIELSEKGYKYAERRWDKMYFGHLLYREYLLAGEREPAKEFRDLAIAELDPGNFPFVDDPTSYGWGLLCGTMGFKFRFADICLESIESVLSEEPELAEYDPEYAYAGAKDLAAELKGPPGPDLSDVVGNTIDIWNSVSGETTTVVVDEENAKFFYPLTTEILRAPPNVHEISYRPYSVFEGARLIVRLRDILESVPKERRSDGFFKAYRYVLENKAVRAMDTNSSNREQSIPSD